MDLAKITQILQDNREKAQNKVWTAQKSHDTQRINRGKVEVYDKVMESLNKGLGESDIVQMLKQEKEAAASTLGDSKVPHNRQMQNQGKIECCDEVIELLQK
jgi:hypothetical protein